MGNPCKKSFVIYKDCDLTSEDVNEWKTNFKDLERSQQLREKRKHWFIMKDFTPGDKCSKWLKKNKPRQGGKCGVITTTPEVNWICAGTENRYCNTNNICDGVSAGSEPLYSLDEILAGTNKECIYANYDLDDKSFFDATRTRFLGSHANWPQNNYLKQTGKELSYIDAENFFKKLLERLLPSYLNGHPLNNPLKRWTLTTDIIGDLRVVTNSHCDLVNKCTIDGSKFKIYDGTEDCFTNPAATFKWEGEQIGIVAYAGHLKECFDVPEIVYKQQESQQMMPVA